MSPDAGEPRRTDVEVVLGDLGPALTQQFFDELEFWQLDQSSLIDVTDVDTLNDPNIEPVVRLCYRAEWSDNEQLARQWVDYPKSSDPGAGDYHHVRRADRETLPFFTASRGARPLSLASRAVLRRLVNEAPGGDFATHLEELLDGIRDAARAFGHSAQLQAALGEVVAPGRLPLDAETTDVNDLIRFSPEGGLIGAILRSLSATADLDDGAGFLPLERHGSTECVLAQWWPMAPGRTVLEVMSGFSPPPPPQAARALVRQFLSRRASAPQISVTLSNDRDSRQGTLEFVNEGGDAAGLVCLCETDHGRQEFDIGGLGAGGVISLSLSGIGEGEFRCAWTCADMRGRRYLWTYDGCRRRLRRHDTDSLEALFEHAYPASANPSFAADA